MPLSDLCVQSVPPTGEMDPFEVGGALTLASYLAILQQDHARGLARGGAVHIQYVEGRGFSLGGEFRGIVGEMAEIVHLLVGEEEIGVGPAFDSLSGADLDKAAAQFEDVEFIAMLDGSDRGGFRGEVFSEGDRDRSDIGDARRWLLRRMGGAGGQ